MCSDMGGGKAPQGSEMAGGQATFFLMLGLACNRGLCILAAVPVRLVALHIIPPSHGRMHSPGQLCCCCLNCILLPLPSAH